MISVGVLKVDFRIPDASSLKDKRRVLKRIKDRIRNSFNVSISEVDHHDKWQMSSLGIACISSDKKRIDSTLNRIRDFFDRERYIAVMDYRIEII